MSEFRRPRFDDERSVETLFDPMHFDRLLALSESICLRHPPINPDVEPTNNPEADVVTSLGVRGLRSALEIGMGTESYHAMKASDGEKLDDDSVVHPINRPDLYSGPLNRELITKATAFGDALFREAYDVLGDDAAGYVEKFRTATTGDEQIEVLEWLHGRLRTIASDNRGLEKLPTPTSDEDEEEDASFYHPLRLSPRAMGRYPNYTLSPTCLGVSMLASGFLQKAGAQFMNAGVMQMEKQVDIDHTVVLIEQGIGKWCHKVGVSVPYELQERLGVKVKELEEVYAEDRGTHTATMVRLVDGRWYQLDPNFSMSTVVPEWRNSDDDEENDNKQIDKIYSTLREFQDIAPGLELSQNFISMSVAALLYAFLDRLNYENAFPDAVREILSDIEDESSLESIRDMMIRGIFLTGNIETNEYYDYVQDAFLGVYSSIRPDKHRELTIEKVFYECLEQFVLWGMPADEWVERCKHDATFRENRVQDIQRLPVLMAIKFCLEMIDRPREPDIHPQLEFGLPETRIGLSVLNNMSIYLGDDLTAHHWISQWPSHVAVADKFGSAAGSNAQDSIILNNTVAYAQSGLRYTAHHGRIRLFMSDRFRDGNDNPESGEQDGTQESQ